MEMCPTTALCRLCLCSSNVFKSLVDQTGEHSETYYIVYKYFDEMILPSEICMVCWQHIHGFYEYQQSVLKAQSNLNDVNNQSAPTLLEMVQIDLDNNDNIKEEHEDYDINEIIDYNPFDSDDNEVLSPDDSKEEISLSGIQLTQEAESNISEQDITEKKLSFKCSICDKYLSSDKSLRVHANTHTLLSTFKCPHCPTKFKGTLSIRRHVRKFHPKEVSNFNVKKLKSLNSSSENNQHSNEVLKDPEQNCFGYTIKEKTNDADKTARSKHAKPLYEVLKDPEKDPFGNIKKEVQLTLRKFKCSKCDREYRDGTDFRSHLATHTKEDIKCPYCSKRFTLSRNVPRHIKLLHPDKYDEYVNTVSYKAKKSHTRKTENANQKLNIRKEEDKNKKNAGILSIGWTSETLVKQLNSVSATSEVETLGPDLHNDNITTESKSKYKCTICNRAYTKSIDLRDHMTYHQNEATNQCPHCPARLTLARNLRRHIKAKHPEKFVEPSVADTRVDLNLLGQHLITLDPTLAIIETQDNITDHLPNYDDYDAFIAKWKQDLECDKCKNTFKTLDILREHFKVEHPQDRCYVVCCGQKISNRMRLVDHIRLHLDPNSFKCKICGRCSTNSRLLKLHMQTHSDEKPFQCNICQKSFRKRQKLITHSGIHSSDKNHVCKVCNKGFSTILLLKKHQYIHKKGFYSKYLCDQCGKPCFSPNVLKEHLLTHHDTETSTSATSEWPCDLCGAKLKTPLTLKIHKKRCHDNKTAYECSECGKISLNKASLKNHKKTAHGNIIGNQNVPKFQCSICLKVLTSALSYRLHAATHNKEGPRFQCPHCPMKLKQKSNIRRHVQIAHPTEFSKMNRRRKSKLDLSLIEQKIVI